MSHCMLWVEEFTGNKLDRLLQVETTFPSVCRLVPETAAVVVMVVSLWTDRAEPP